jgi:hypothetical protein
MLPTHALSLLQPWLWFVVNQSHPSPKRLENRTRRVMNWREWKPRGEFWLHASKGDDSAYWTDAIERVRAIFGPDYPVPRAMELPRVGIVARARIAGMVTPKGEIQMEPGEELAPGSIDMRWHFPGQHAYVLVGVRPVPFTPARGALGFWVVPPTVLDHLRANGER